MANIVLVTKQCYLLCESINYIAVHEMSEDEKEESLLWTAPAKKQRRRKKLTAKQKLLEQLKKAAQLYQITIDFIPVPNSPNAPGNSRRDGTSSVAITVRGADRCLELYKDMIMQIREQQPDKLFLDKMVEKFFADNPLEEVE